MPQRDLKNNIQVVHLNNYSFSGVETVHSDWVDTRGFDTCTFVVMTGTVADAGTAAGVVFEVQDSDLITDVSGVAVADAELIGGDGSAGSAEAALSILNDTDDDLIIGTIGYVGDARYVRLDGTASTLSDVPTTIIAILSNGFLMPSNEGVGTSVAAT